MTGRERLLAALRRQPVDELPVLLKGMNPYSPTRAYRGKSWDAVFEANAERGDIFAITFPQRNIHSDSPVIRTSKCIARTGEYEDWETTYETPDGILTEVRRNMFLAEAILQPAIKSKADFPAAKWVLSDVRPIDETATRKHFEDILAEPNTLPLLCVPQPLDAVVELMGPEQYALCLAEAPDELDALTQSAVVPIIRELEDTLRLGLDIAVWDDGAEWCTPPYSGGSHFHTLIFPYMKRIAGIAHQYDRPVLTHCHSKISGVFDQLLASGTDGTHPFEPPPSGDMTPEELKRKANGHLCFVGNIQLDDIMRAPKTEIQRQVEHLVEIFSDWSEGGFILSVSGTPICREAPEQAIENYLYLLHCKNRI